MRGDPRVYNFYEVHKSNMRLYSLEWLYGSDIQRYKELAVEFASFVFDKFEEIETVDLIDINQISDGLRLKFFVDESIINELRGKQETMNEIMTTIKSVIKAELEKVNGV